ncbi:helicase-related protein [endosymbiont of Lamellibrachia barhami]|uniref:helicase-related protein n=1 Tax=endosymbiont of Lamellibrachia barhami TaxID=205975 RepID=UPI001FECFE33|nr:helicase-related protein [endosymbiont of Lamellibrachia barhami]
MVDWLRMQLIGPGNKNKPPIDSESDEVILQGISPLDRYPTGVLFPVIRGEEGLDPASDNDEEDAGIGEEKETIEVEPAARQRRYSPPSSVGFSFFARGEPARFQVISSAVRYIRVGERDERGRYTRTEYKRIEVGGESEAKTFEARNRQTHKQFSCRENVFGEDAGVDVLWRPFLDGWIVTVSLFNNRQEGDVKGTPKLFKGERNEKSLFEVKLSCVLEAGEIGTYPRVDKSLLTEEEQELELQYKQRHIYAVGHGAAVDWSVEGERVQEIWSEFLPTVEVPQVTAYVKGAGNSVLGLVHLAAGGDETGIWDELDEFVSTYSKWVSEEKQKSLQFDPEDLKAAGRITKRMDTVLHRMQRGVSMLRSDSRAAKAFQLANQSMLDQMRQSDQVRGKFREEMDYKWRPFQLAFLLTVVESVVNEDDDFRDTVDLIWFPTGGGKTEAYLGLIAFLIVWRRFKYPATGGGTTIIMRYTLRLLTAQQYLRATRLICALELIRRMDTSLGVEPITIGMWVGAATSPNAYLKAMEFVQQASDGKVSALQRLVLDSCPWCGTSFKAPDSYISTQTQFHFCCTNPECDFSRGGNGQLPCNVVDEALYEKPPTILLATVDKFARLAWDERTNAFFGRESNRPPELVIQDELHLIAGALGSVVGIYEAALDTILIQRGVHAKYIASTATIRMAQQQVERLYGRELAIFPPPGLSSDNSYFAKTINIDDKHPGRLYVGYLAPMLNRQHCMAPLAAALHIAPEAVFQKGEVDRDDLLEAWWTQVVYHGSLKGVGNSHNAFTTGVRDLVRRLKEELKKIQNNNGESGVLISRPNARIAQLTSISSAEENARTFSRLERSREEVDCLDAVLATNMISVGLDVPRLALMIINGQPLTTAEYIQASSRVGRSGVPGLVFANYYRDQARSLSHYENFRPYHDSFYRFVEPTSVTPYTYQARTRALHAALVIAIRHSCVYLLGNNLAGQFNPTDDCVQKVIESLKRRCAQADPDRAEETAIHIDRLVEQWRAEAQHSKASRIQLGYQAPDNDKAMNRLLYNHDDRIKGLWPTLQSMRNVENSALLKPL